MSLVIQDTIASSTFWLVAGLLFITLLAVFDDLIKTKDELKRIKASNDANYRDISALLSRVGRLEKPVVVSPPSPKPVKTSPNPVKSSPKTKSTTPISEIESEFSEED